MREIFTYGSVGGAPGNRCFYPERRPGASGVFQVLSFNEGRHYSNTFAFPRPSGEARR